MLGLGVDGQRRRRQPGSGCCGRRGYGWPGVGTGDVLAAMDSGGRLSPGLRCGLPRQQIGAIVSASDVGKYAGARGRPRPSPLVTIVAVLASPSLAPPILRVFRRASCGDAAHWYSRPSRWCGVLLSLSLFRTGWWRRPRLYPSRWRNTLCGDDHTSLSRDSGHVPFDARILLPNGTAEKASAVPLTVTRHTRRLVPLLEKALVVPLAVARRTGQ